MKKKTMFKAFNALVRASAKEIRWSDGDCMYIPARKPLNGKYMRHVMHVARVYQSNRSAGFVPVMWTPDGMECDPIRGSFIFRGTPKFSNKHKYVLVWQDDNKYFAVCRADTAEQNR